MREFFSQTNYFLEHGSRWWSITCWIEQTTQSIGKWDIPNWFKDTDLWTARKQTTHFEFKSSKGWNCTTNHSSSVGDKEGSEQEEEALAWHLFLGGLQGKGISRLCVTKLWVGYWCKEWNHIVWWSWQCEPSTRWGQYSTGYTAYPWNPTGRAVSCGAMYN